MGLGEVVIWTRDCRGVRGDHSGRGEGWRLVEVGGLEGGVLVVPECEGVFLDGEVEAGELAGRGWAGGEGGRCGGGG